MKEIIYKNNKTQQGWNGNKVDSSNINIKACRSMGNDSINLLEIRIEENTQTEKRYLSKVVSFVLPTEQVKELKILLNSLAL